MSNTLRVGDACRVKSDAQIMFDGNARPRDYGSKFTGSMRGVKLGLREISDSVNSSGYRYEVAWVSGPATGDHGDSRYLEPWNDDEYWHAATGKWVPNNYISRLATTPPHFSTPGPFYGVASVTWSA